MNRPTARQDGRIFGRDLVEYISIQLREQEANRKRIEAEDTDESEAMERELQMDAEEEEILPYLIDYDYS